MKKIQVNKGIDLHIIQTEKFKTTTLCILIRRQLSRKESTMNGLIPNVLRRGCKKYDSIKKINRVMEEMYGAVFNAEIVKKGEEQIIQLLIEFVDKEERNRLMGQAIEFLYEILVNPLIEGEGFNEDITKSEIENLRNNIKGRINNKAEYAKLRCLNEMCSNEPFGIYADGYEEDLEEIDSVKLYRHYKRVLFESPIEWIMIGNIDAKFTEDKIREIFILERRNIVRTKEPFFIEAPTEINIVKEEALNITQGKMCIGLRSNVKGNSKEFFSLMVLNEIFGGSPNSKLFMNIREEKSLCYTIGSFVYRFKGIIFIQCGADAEKLEEIYQIIIQQLTTVKKGDFTAQEFDNAKNSLLKKFQVIKDYPSSTLDFYLSQYMLEQELSLDEFCQEIRSINENDIKETAVRLNFDTVYFLS